MLPLKWLFSKEDERKPPASAFVNLQLRNSMALMRRCCNHPYLIEYPMDSGELRVDEALVTASGKLMLLDSMLAQLKKNGHKVLCCSIELFVMFLVLAERLHFLSKKSWLVLYDRVGHWYRSVFAISLLAFYMVSMIVMIWKSGLKRL